MSPSSPGELPPVGVRDLNDADLLLDVREDSEWAAGHAPGAVHLPMSQLPARLDEVPRDRTVSVVCHLGGRSAQVTAYLAAQGFAVRDVRGGMQAWEDQGLPVVTDDGSPGQVV